MGRMKEVYIEIMEKYGHIPKDFSLKEYNFKKELDYAELQEIEEELKKIKSSQNDDKQSYRNS